MKTRPLLRCVALCLLATSAHSAPPPASAATAVTFKSLKDLVEVLPHSLIQQFKVGGKVEGSRQEANRILMEKAVGKTATLKVHVQDWQPWAEENDDDKMRIAMVTTPVTVLGTTFKVNVWILIPQNQVAMLGKISRGGEITATGELTRLEIDNTPEGLKMTGALRHAKLETRADHSPKR